MRFVVIVAASALLAVSAAWAAEAPAEVQPDAQSVVNFWENEAIAAKNQDALLTGQLATLKGQLETARATIKDLTVRLSAATAKPAAEAAPSAGPVVGK